MQPAPTSQQSHSSRQRLWLTLLVLVGLGVRLLGIELQPLWWDEGFSVYFATESTPRLLELTSLDIHPPLYYLLLQGWYQLVGVGAIQSRWLSVLLGVLAIPLVWQATHHFFGKRSAWIAALLLTFSPFHIYYSQEVRMYGLMVVLALAAVVAWQGRQWVALGLAVLAGLLTQYYFALLAGALGLIILWELRQRLYGWQGPVRAMLIAGLGYLPWVLYALPRLITYVGGKLVVEADAPMTPLEFLPRHLAAWSVGHLSSSLAPLGWVALIFVLLIGLALYQHQSSTRSAVGYTTLLWLLPTIAIFIVGLFAPFTDARIERQLLFVLPFFLMLVAVSIANLWQRSVIRAGALLAGLLLISVVSLSDFYTVPRYPREDYRPLLAEVDGLQGPDDGWLAIYEWQIGYLRAYLPDTEPDAVAVNVAWAEDTTALQEGIATLLETYPRVWLPAYQVKGRIFEEQLVSTLDSEGLPVWDEWYGNTRLYLFGQPSGNAAEGQQLGTYATLELVTGAVARQQVASGTGIVPVLVSASVPAETARISIQVVGRGAVWGEWDGPLQDGAVKAGVPIMAGTPPGEYEVYGTLYDGATSLPFPRSEQGVLQAPEAFIGTVTIERPTSPLALKSVQRLATLRDSKVLANAIQWLGVALPETPLLQGDTLPVTLLWQSLQPQSADVRVFIQGFDAQGALKINHEIAPVNGTFPLPQWQAGDLVRDPHTVQLPPDLPAGDYRLVAGMYDPATGQRLTTEAGQDTLDLGTIEVVERERLLEAPTIGEGVAYSFGGRVELVQVASAPTEVTLLWKSTQTGGSPLRAFVQIYHEESQIAVSDHPLDPPATAWVTGEYIVDVHSIPLPPDLPAGTYRIIAGVVDDGSDIPLTTPEGASFVEIGRVVVE